MKNWIDLRLMLFVCVLVGAYCWQVGQSSSNYTSLDRSQLARIRGGDGDTLYGCFLEPTKEETCKTVAPTNPCKATKCVVVIKGLDYCPPGTMGESRNNSQKEYHPEQCPDAPKDVSGKDTCVCLRHPCGFRDKCEGCEFGDDNQTLFCKQKDVAQLNVVNHWKRGGAECKGEGDE